MKGFPGGSDGEEFTCNAGDLGLILGLGRSSGGGNGNPLQDSSLNNPMDREDGMSRTSKFIEAESRLEVTRTWGWGWGRIESYWLKRTILSGVMKIFWK